MGSAASRSLQLTKLQALAGAPPWSDRQWAPVDFGPGAALRAEDDGAPTAVVFPSEPGRRSLGEALVWADRHGVDHLDLLIDPSAVAAERGGTSAPTSADTADPDVPSLSAGVSASSSGAEPEDDIAAVLGRRAGWFAAPEVTVYRLVIPHGERPRPEPVVVPPLWLSPPADLHHPLVTLMAEAGVEIVAEGGIVRGEVNGLEVARVVPVADHPFPGPAPAVLDSAAASGAGSGRSPSAPDGAPVVSAVPDATLAAPGVNGAAASVPPGPGVEPSEPGADQVPSWGPNVVDGYRLDVGVGQADRELTAYVHAGAPPAAEVARVRDTVRKLRRGDAARHPLNQLVPERWLRAAVIRRPERLGLASLRPVRRVPARVGMTEIAVAAAEGTTLDGRSVVAVFSVGMDIDLVPAAAEMLAYAVAEAAFAERPAEGATGSAAGDVHGVSGGTITAGSSGTPALWLVVPQRDVHPVVHRLATALREPAVVVPVPDDWRTW